MLLPEKHFNETKRFVKQIDSSKIASWLLNHGYYPEQYILPPTFDVSDFELKDEPYISDLSNPPRRQILNVSYPKSLLTGKFRAIRTPIPGDFGH